LGFTAPSPTCKCGDRFRRLTESRDWANADVDVSIVGHVLQRVTPSLC
jgi:hypothetical protein